VNSLRGAAYLSGLGDAIVIDIGETTSAGAYLVILDLLQRSHCGHHLKHIRNSNVMEL
jgi:hypothetical protein